MYISNNFKNDTLSNNTELVPVVLLEKQVGVSEWEYYALSTISGELKIAETSGDPTPIHLDPYLLSVPKVKDSIDVFTHKHKTSNVKIKLTNANIKGKRLGEILQDTKVANIDVTVYFKSQTTNRLIPYHKTDSVGADDTDCLKLYTGKIRDVKYSKDALNVSLEDISSVKIHKDLPRTQVGEDAPPKYRNQYIPMVYGKVISPLARMSQSIFVADTEEIYGYQSDVYNPVIEEPPVHYGPIQVFENDEYTPLVKYVWYKFVTEPIIDGNPNPNYADFNLGYEQYEIENDNTITMPFQGLMSVNRIQCLYTGTPNEIKLLRYDYKGGHEGGADQSGYDLIGTEGYGKIAGESSYHEVEDWVDCRAYITPIADPLFGIYADDRYYSYPIPCWLFQWNFHNENTMWSKLLETKLNGAVLPVAGDIQEWEPAGLDGGMGWYGDSNGNFPAVWVGDNFQGLWAVNPDQAFRETDNPYNFDSGEFYPEWYYGGPGAFNGTAYNRIVIQRAENYTEFFNNLTIANNNSYSSNFGGQVNWSDPATDILYCATSIDNAEDNPLTFSSRDWNNSADFKLQSEMPYGPDHEDIWQHDCFPMLRLSEGKYVYADFDSGEGESIDRQPSNFYNMGIFGCVHYDGTATNPSEDVGNSTLNSDFRMHMKFKIESITAKSIVDYQDADEKKYFGYVLGRVDDELRNYEHSEEESEYNPEYLSNPIDIIRHIAQVELGITKFDEEEFDTAWVRHMNWDFGFAVTKQINSKKLLEDMSKSTFSYPRIKSDGTFGFVTIKKEYSSADYFSATEIQELDVIKYDFKLSPANKVVSKLSMEWGKNYGSNKYTRFYDANQTSYSYTNTSMDSEYATPSKNFSGIEDEDDNHKTFKSPYFQGIGYAQANGIAPFRREKFENEKVQHLTSRMELPLKYSHLEVGDLIKFPKNKLLDNIKPFGIDYTNPVGYGGTLRYPLFLVTSISRSLKSLIIDVFQVHWLEQPKHNASDPEPYEDIMQDPFWGNTSNNPFFPDANYTDPFRLINWEAPEPPEEPEPPVLESMFLIGSDSEFEGSEMTHESAYERRFHVYNLGDDGYPEAYQHLWSHADPFTYDDSLYYFCDWKSELFGPARFGLSSYDELIPEANADNSGYGSILNGLADNQVGGFVALRYKTYLQVDFGVGYENAGYHQRMDLRNVAGTIFDEDAEFYDENAIIPHQFNECIVDEVMHSTEIRLGWVGFIDYAGDDFDGMELNLNGNPIIIPENQVDDPLFGYERTRKSQEIMVMYFNDYQTILAGLNTSSEYSHALQLYPNAIPTQMNDLTLEYNGVWDLVLLPNWAEIVAGGGDSNLDGTLNVLDIVGTVAHILGNAELSPEGALAADFNGDGTLNVLDIVATVNAILGND